MKPRKTIRKAIRILMLSPVYFRLDPQARLALIREFCTLHVAAIA